MEFCSWQHFYCSFLNTALLRAWGAWESVSPKSRSSLERSWKLVGWQESGDSKSLGEHEKRMTAMANPWLLCAGCKLLSWLWTASHKWQHGARGCWIIPCCGQRKKQRNGITTACTDGLLRDPQIHPPHFRPTAEKWYLATYPLLKPHSSFPSSSHLPKAYGLCLSCELSPFLIWVFLEIPPSTHNHL